jgi:hypothetical protein
MMTYDRETLEFDILTAVAMRSMVFRVVGRST